MTNAEKFKEVFGFRECTQVFCRDCPWGDNIQGCKIDDFWKAEYNGPIEDAAKHEPKPETATIGGWDPVKRFDEIFRKEEKHETDD